MSCHDLGGLPLSYRAQASKVKALSVNSDVCRWSVPLSFHRWCTWGSRWGFRYGRRRFQLSLTSAGSGRYPRPSFRPLCSRRRFQFTLTLAGGLFIHGESSPFVKLADFLLLVRGAVMIRRNYATVVSGTRISGECYFCHFGSRGRDLTRCLTRGSVWCRWGSGLDFRILCSSTGADTPWVFTLV